MVLAGAAVMYFLTINLQPQNGLDEEKVFVNIANALSNTTSVRFPYIFKVVGESTVLAVVEVSDVDALEDSLSKVYKLGPIKTTCKPIITYDAFGKQLGISDELTNQGYTALPRKNLVYSKCYIEYYGNTTDELFAAWKNSVEASLIKKRDRKDSEVFKNVSEREIHIIVSDPDQPFLDIQTLQLPIVQAFGSNIHFFSKGLQNLADYVADIKSPNIY